MLFRTLLILAILVVVTVAGVFVTNGRFELRLDRVEPSTAFVGQEITLTGSGFVASEAVAVFFNGVQARPSAVAAGAIRVQVPDTARSGVVAIQTAKARSNTRYIEIVHDATRTGPMANMEWVTARPDIPPWEEPPRQAW